MWEIEAPDKFRIELYDFKIDLPYKADYASCNMHDYLKITNTNTTLEICRSNKIKYVLSTLNKLIIRFISTTYMTKATGIQFSIRIWGM